VADYERALERHAYPVLGRLRLVDIEPRDVRPGRHYRAEAPLAEQRPDRDRSGQGDAGHRGRGWRDPVEPRRWSPAPHRAGRRSMATSGFESHLRHSHKSDTQRPPHDSVLGLM